MLLHGSRQAGSWLIFDVRQNMSTRDDVHPLESLAAALGGRLLYAFLWILWLCAALIGHYVQDMTRAASVQRGSKVTLAICVTGLLFYAFLLIRSLVSKERRDELFSLQRDWPKPRLLLRVLIWLVPMLALGALLAPSLIR